MNTPSTFPPFLSPSAPPAAAGGSVWRRAVDRLLAAFEVAGAARARSEMLADAGRFERLQPQLAAELRAAAAHPGSY